MKWNGTVSHVGMTSIAARLANENATQATSIHRSRCGHSIASGRIEAVPHPADRGDHVRTEFRAEAADVHVHNVRSRIEVVPPDRRQQPLLRDRAPRVSAPLLQ